jgi:hypothetical protein
MTDPTQPRPWQAGVVAGRHRFSKEKVQAAEQRLSAATDLSDFAKEHLLFSPALLYCCIDLAGRDPLADYGDEQNVNVMPMRLTFDRPLFEGLERFNEFWNRTIYALPTTEGQRLLQWLGTLTFVDRVRQEVSRLRYNEHRIIDPLWAGKRVTLPGHAEYQWVVVNMLCVDSNRGCLYFANRVEPWKAGPSLSYSRPFKDTILLGEKIFQNDPRPLQAVEAAQHTEAGSVAEREIQERVRRYRQGEDPSCPKPNPS